MSADGSAPALGPRSLSNAHGDVVPPGRGWTADPYGAEIRDGVMYGRGVAVSKSDFATYAFALKAIETAGRGLDGTIELHLTYDEESGGLLGPGWLLERGLTRPDYVIGAGFTYNIVVAHNGCLHLEVRLEGRSAHAARPETGADALEAAARVLAALYALWDTYTDRRSDIAGIEHPTLVVGLIQGGINTNVVPDLPTMRIDRRILPEEDPEQVERELTACIESAVAGREGIKLGITRILLARPLTPGLGQERLVAVLRRRAGEILGEEILADGVPLFTDARHYSAASIGADGVLSGLASLTPHLFVDLLKAERANDLAGMRKASNGLYPVVRAIYGARPPMDMHTRIKIALQHLGIVGHATPRPPLLPVREDVAERVRRTIDQVRLAQRRAA